MARWSARCEVTWGGTGVGPGPLGDRPGPFTELAQAGATWVVCAWPESLEAVAEVAHMLRDA